MSDTLFWDEMAIASFKHILDQDPSQANAHYHLGIAYNRTGKANKAIRAFQRAIKLDKNLADAHYQLGITYQQIGKQTEAMRCLNNYKKIQEADSSMNSDVLDSLMHTLQEEKDS